MDMRIHVVRPGESVWGIAHAYGVTHQDVIAANDLPEPDRLVPGQALVVPAGAPQTPRHPAEANAYVEPRGREQDREVVAAVAAYLTYVTMFEYRVNRDGTIDPLRDAQARAAARAGDAMAVLALTNIAEEQFSRELGEAVLASTDLQDRVLDNVLRLMRERGFGGLNIDFEHLRPADREPYNQFLRRAAERVHAAGFTLSTALAPKVSAEQTGAWYEAHDYPAHGQIADFSVLMTYEWGWSGGPPRAVAPLSEVERVIRYAVSAMPPQKIMMGMPLYGYDWTLPYVRGGPFARVVSPQEAIALAARHSVTIRYDPDSQSPFFRYRDPHGREHEVWFEDARSVQAKLNLVKQHNLRGVSYWRLPISFPQNWLLLAENFEVRKL
jgi:spore germination protein